MIKSSGKITLIIVTLILFAFLGANFNVFYFSHWHIDENGNIIVHAHPYKKTDQSSQQTTSHSHSKSEFVLLALIYNILTLFSFLLFIFVSLLKLNQNLKVILSYHWNPSTFFSKHILRRGPPSMLHFA